MNKVQFKFRENTAAPVREQVITLLAAEGAKAVRQLFPGETDPELAALYIVDFTNEKTGLHLLHVLNRSKAVEFAEGEVKRTMKSS
ncbi:MAG: hypothetical protein HY646_06320 [Acidobacteria bacterium]|nr:hypothetical protein [Acidobacteriota bacterium]